MDKDKGKYLKYIIKYLKHKVDPNELTLIRMFDFMMKWLY